MAVNTVSAGLGELVVSKDPNSILVAYGLGSCVGVALYDPVAKVGALLHAMLPLHRNGDANKTKFVDTGIPAMLEKVEKLGAKRSRLICQMAGGAQMLTAPGFNNVFNIGEQNAKQARKVLKKEGVHLRAEETGGHAGRTVKLHIANGRVTLRSMGQEEKEL